ncbi:MAG: type II secretion system protein GspC [Gammaproteobacteria bacterium]|nr:MAG: type II secretion system protein GspC [Gammaproteobacteria bacterium]
MLVNRSSLSRFAVPQTSAEWEQILARYITHISRVPVSTWQFLVRVILVCCLALSLGRLFWLVFPVPTIPAGSVAISTSAAPADTGSSGVNISQLKSIPVFGKVEAPKPQDQQQQQQAAAPIETNVVNTQLNLTLVGVVASNEEASSRAIIGSGDKQDVYAINDTLPVGNNVTLSKVMADRVIINNNGQYESVWLYQADPNAPPISQASMSPVEQQQPVYPSGRPGFGGPEQHSPQEGAPSVAEVSRNLSDVLAMSIYRENGRVVGYKIRPGRDAERFKSFGLQNDDVVTAINGTPLTDPAKIMEVYKNMGNTTSANLEIKRGGNVINVDVVLQ